MVKEEWHKEKVRMILPRIGMREARGKEGRNIGLSRYTMLISLSPSISI
ncbi:MAG: hypothetical protein WA631_04540 [Nitrososphaeraceae archaeon]